MKKLDKIRVSGFWIDTEKAMKKKVDVVTTDAEMENEFREEITKELVKIYG